MDKQETAAALRYYAVLVELLGEDSFRARAFDNAARSLEAQPESLQELIHTGKLAAIKGVGKSVASAITELAARGSFAELESAEAQVPPTIFELLRVEGLGPKRVRTLWTAAQVTSLDELETAIEAGRLHALPGFGEKMVQKCRASLSFLQSTAGRHWRHHAHRAAEALRAELAGIANIQEIFFGGSLRRGLETVGDLDVILIADDAHLESVRRAVQALHAYQWTESGALLEGKTATGFDVDLSVVPPREAGLRKILATGSKEHRQALRDLAARKGLTLEPASFFGESEEDVYTALGLTYVPPALREAATELRPLGSAPYPEPVQPSQIRGILHTHTPASDGHHTLRELAEAMIAKGYEYLGIADHSQAAAYAGGLTPDRVRAQWREIDALNRELSPFLLLKGTEVDILADGRPDFDDDLLAGFDYVIASIHSGFNMTEAQATERLCRALSNPHVDILGHATGRLLLERVGYPVNHERLIECAAEHGKGIELNSNPHRLDLDWRWIAACEVRGIPIPLCPDAHAIEGLWDIRYGLEVAAKGPLTAANCPNTWSADEFLNWCQTHTRNA